MNSRFLRARSLIAFGSTLSQCQANALARRQPIPIQTVRRTAQARQFNLLSGRKDQFRLTAGGQRDLNLPSSKRTLTPELNRPPHGLRGEIQCLKIAQLRADLAAAESACGCRLADLASATVAALQHEGLLEMSGHLLRLTPEGYPLANAVVTRLMTAIGCESIAHG
jgi:hypothetical protein